MKRNKFKLLSVLIIVTVAVSLFGIIFRNNNFLVGGVRTIFVPFLTFSSKISNEIKDFRMYFSDMKSYKEENTRLAEENAELKRSGVSISEYREENERLRELLNLKNEMEDRFSIIPSKVVSYEPNNWYNTIIINKGKWSGVSVGDAVISTNGVVGKISEVGLGYSVVSTFLNADNSIGVRNTRNGKLAICEGDAELSKKMLCKMSFIEGDSNVALGDVIETTGSAGVYPAHIKLGTVKEIKADEAVSYAVIEPSVNLSELYEVLVVCRGDEN